MPSNEAWLALFNGNSNGLLTCVGLGSESDRGLFGGLGLGHLQVTCVRTLVSNDTLLVFDSETNVHTIYQVKYIIV